ncbi:MAG: hypothetical protein JXA66_07455 [Oligoflexia bacterium]|nr:hypothetical protein [Oligoflexia bacterium]
MKKIKIILSCFFSLLPWGDLCSQKLPETYCKYKSLYIDVLEPDINLKADSGESYLEKYREDRSSWCYIICNFRAGFDLLEVKNERNGCYDPLFGDCPYTKWERISAGEVMAALEFDYPVHRRLNGRKYVTNRADRRKAEERKELLKECREDAKEYCHNEGINVYMERLKDCRTEMLTFRKAGSFEHENTLVLTGKCGDPTQ